MSVIWSDERKKGRLDAAHQPNGRERLDGDPSREGVPSAGSSDRIEPPILRERAIPWGEDRGVGLGFRTKNTRHGDGDGDSLRAIRREWRRGVFSDRWMPYVAKFAKFAIIGFALDLLLGWLI